MKTRPYHYCIMQVGKDPKIIEVQGLTWFETDDLAYEYWGHMNMEFQKKIGPISVISEENLPYFFDCNSEYIKAKLTGTRLLKSKEPVGVKVTNDQKVITEYYKPNESSFMKNYQEGGAGYDDTKEYIDPEFPEEPSGPTQQMIDDNTIGIGELK